MHGYSLWNDCVVIRFANKRIGWLKLCIHWLFLCGENHDGSMLFLVVMGILLEGFALFSLAGYFLTIMVTMSGCIWVSMGLMYMFSNYLLLTCWSL
jgi:hypothetical protein